jgi:hypothetical protein
MGMIGRLGQREWFAAKVCVCTLIVPMIKTFPHKRQELLEYENIFFLNFVVFLIPMLVIQPLWYDKPQQRIWLFALNYEE